MADDTAPPKPGDEFQLEQSAIPQDEGSAVAARQQAQQSQILPAARQPYSPGLQPQEAGLEHPAVSPEEVLAAGAAPLAARATGAVAEAAAPFARQLISDEAGVLKFPEASSVFSQGILPKAEAGFTGKLAEAKQLLEEITTKVSNGQLPYSSLQAATQRYSRELDKAQRLTNPVRMAEGGSVSSPSVFDQIVAKQQAQQAQMLPPERQPYSSGLQPQEAGLENPAISPEELVGGGLASSAARATMGAADALAPTAGRLLADEAGMAKLPHLARAAEQGFDPSQTYYHGTSADFKGFKVSSDPKNGAILGQGVYLTESPDVANTYANSLGNAGGNELAFGLPGVRERALQLYPEHAGIKDNSELFKAILKTKGKNAQFKELSNILEEAPTVGGNVLPVHIRANRPFDTDSTVDPKIVKALKKELPKELSAALDKHETNADLLQVMTGRLPAYRVTQLLEDAGYDSVKHGDVRVIFDPKNIRSKFAEFDPAKAGSSNLSYAQGGVVQRFAEGGLAGGDDAYQNEFGKLGGVSYDKEFSTPTATALGAAATARAPAVAAAAPAQDTAVNVITPTGELKSLPSSQLAMALQHGFTQATPEDIAAYQRHEKYGTLGQQLLTGAEGFGAANTFGLSTGLETALGVNPHDISERRAENPLSHMGGEGLGLVASSFVPGVGAANLLEHAAAPFGEAVIQGITHGVASSAGQSIVAKIGSEAVKGAIGNMLFQGGDEVSKAFSGEMPDGADKIVGTVLADVGLSGLIGGGISGGIGTISPLWRATMGSRAGGVLKALSDKLSGVGGQVPDAVSNAIERTGIDVAPEVKAAMASDPHVRQMSQTLSDAATSSGLEHQAAKQAFYKQSGEAVANALGKTPEDLVNLSKLSEHDAGDEIKSSLTKTLQEAYAPVKENYNKISSRFKETEFTDASKATLGEKIGEIASGLGSSESAEAKLTQRVLREITGIKNLEGLRNYTSGIGNETSGIAKQELWGIGRKLKGALRDAEDATLTGAVADKAPELMELHAATRKSYGELRGVIEDLNDRLKVGPHAGPETFIKALKDMDGEAVLRRLSPKGKADIIGELSGRFPEVANLVRDYNLSSVLKGATKDGTLHTGNFIKGLDKLSPEMRQFLVPGETATKIEAVKTLLEALPEKVGKSGTPQGLDALMGGVPATAVGLASMLTGHSPAASALVGYMTKLASRDAPDAVRLSLLKFLGSDKPLEAGGFKAMVDYIHAAQKGEKLVANAAANIFKAGREVLPQSKMPTDSDRKRLDKQLKGLQTNQEPLLDTGGKAAHYLPEHGVAMGQVAANATQYLNSLRPNTDRKSPLDTKMPASPQEQAKFNRALDIAEQPLVVMQSLKNGSLTPSDVATLKLMYPSLYQKLTDKLTASMTDAIAKEETIPYKTKLALSVFMGQPLDSTMTAPSIVAAQPKPVEPMQQQTAKDGGSHKSNALSKLPGAYQTPDQARTQRMARD